MTGRSPAGAGLGAAFPVRRAAVVALLAGAALGSCSIFHQDLPNQSPIVQVSEADTLRVRRSGQVTLRVTASDEDDDPLTYEWIAFHLGPELEAGRFTDPRASTTRWIAPAAISDSLVRYRIVVTVHDNQPDTEDPHEEFVIEVVQRPPVLSAPGDTTVSFREPEVVLEASASDPDGDVLSFEWEVVEGRRVRMETRAVGPNRSQARLTSLIPDSIRVAVATTDGSDTVRAEFWIDVQAPPMPEGGTAALDLSLPGGGTKSYEIDVYEYPNRRGAPPRLVDDWFQAAALCRARGARLCTPAEWVRACRGPEGRRFSSGDDPAALPESFGLRFCNQTGSDLAGDDPALDATAPSGSFPNCASSTGVFDLTGNAPEWLVDFDSPAAGDAGSAGRIARFSTSSTAFPGAPCTQLSPPLATLPLEGGAPVVPLRQDFVDSVLAAPVPAGRIDSLRQLPAFSTYFASGRGFRCCR